MGRNARRRAEKHEAGHPHGVPPPDEEERKPPTRCPRCGSTDIWIGRTVAFQRTVDIICGKCGFQGELSPGVW
jgi:predicted RNA-binding Zn-ribbon protein involved in translation (DUF1610 family)